MEGRDELLWDPENSDITDLVDTYERQVIRTFGREIARKFPPFICQSIIDLLEGESNKPFSQLAQGMMVVYSQLETALDALKDLTDGIKDVLAESISQ